MTRYVEAWPTKNVDTKSAISVLLKHVLYRHSCPLVCDQGSSFTSHEFKAFCLQKGIKLKFTAPYKPDSNGVCERKNAVIKSIIAKYVNKSHKNWDQFVPAAAYAANIAVHKITKFSPFKLVYGYDPILPSEVENPFLIVDDE